MGRNFRPVWLLCLILSQYRGYLYPNLPFSRWDVCWWRHICRVQNCVCAGIDDVPLALNDEIDHAAKLISNISFQKHFVRHSQGHLHHFSDWVLYFGFSLMFFFDAFFFDGSACHLYANSWGRACLSYRNLMFFKQLQRVLGTTKLICHGQDPRSTYIQEPQRMSANGNIWNRSRSGAR